MTTEAQRIARIRDGLAVLAGAEWMVEDRRGELWLVAAQPLRAGSKSSSIGIAHDDIARFAPGATADERDLVVSALGSLRLLLALFDRSVDKVRALNAELAALKAGPPPPNFSGEAAIKCADPLFQAWLAEVHGLARPVTTDSAAQRLRGLLGIASRAELNDDEDAAARWKAMRAQFDAWRKARRG